MKKIMAGVLATCMFFSPLTSMAATSEADIMLISTQEESNDAENMEKVLLVVKSKISIPEDLNEFSYRLHYSGGDYSKSKYWSFEWRNKESDRSISIMCNDAGNILSYSTYNRDKGRVAPTYLKEELIKNATDFIDKIAPEISEKIVLTDSNFSGVYSGAYSYIFERIENDIKMPDNRVVVDVNYETGEITRFNADWVFDVEIPFPEVNITLEEAREKIGEKVEMSLKYMNKTEKINDKEVVKAYLVYVPSTSYMAVDAKTGEVYDTRDEFHDMEEYQNSMKESPNFSDMAMDEAGGLTEEEIEKINEMENLITKEQAIEAVTSKKDVLLLDENAKAVQARLIQRYNYAEQENTNYVWNLNFSDPRDVNTDIDTYRAYANVTVDAESGKILSYNASVRRYYDPESKEWEDVEIKYTSEECQETFEQLAKSLESEKFANTKLSDSTDTAYVLKYIADNPVYGGYSYNYSRVNEGIEYTYNNISGKVDGVTGKIYSYNVNWTDNIEFESPKGAISPEQAYKAYSEKDGFNLVYEINNKHYIENNPIQDEYYDYSDLYILDKEVRLVYRTDINPQYISPFTGEQLDYSGNVYEDINEKEYTDISGFWGERSIKLITDMGYSFEGDEFLPEKVITKEEWFKLLNTVGRYINEEEYESLEKVTKLDAINMIIKSLNLEHVAELSDIYKLSFNDMNKVTNSDIGYVALAKGLGIVSGDSNNNLNPDKELSRIEAICMALKLANVE